MKNHLLHDRATPFIPSEQAQAALNQIPSSFHNRIITFTYQEFHGFGDDEINQYIEEIAELIEESLNEFLTQAYNDTGPAKISNGLTLDTVAKFTWDFGRTFLLETPVGNFIWSDPDYGGDNTIVPFDGDYNKWVGDVRPKNGYGGCKGTHTIREYCGENVIIKQGKLS